MTNWTTMKWHEETQKKYIYKQKQIRNTTSAMQTQRNAECGVNLTVSHWQ